MITPEPMSEPTAVTVPESPTAVVRHAAVTVSELRGLFDNGYQAIAASGAVFAGPAFAIFRGDPADRFDLELGFPVQQPLPGPVEGEIVVEPSSFPSGQALALSHLGNYESLGESWGVLAAEFARRGGTVTALVEVYVTEPSPEADPATLRTDLFLLF